MQQPKVNSYLIKFLSEICNILHVCVTLSVNSIKFPTEELIFHHKNRYHEVR